MRSATAMQPLVTALVNIMKTCSSNARGHAASAVSIKFYSILQNISTALLFHKENQFTIHCTIDYNQKHIIMSLAIKLHEITLKFVNIL